MEPEICTKILRNLSEKLAAKCFATTLSYSMVNIARLDDTFSESFELKASPIEGQSLQQEDKTRRKRTSVKKKINEIKTPNFDFCLCPRKNVAKPGLVERRACCHVANAFLRRLELIGPISRPNISKISKKCVFFGKELRESMGKVIF